jgi:hypothetical protein
MTHSNPKSKPSSLSTQPRDADTTSPPPMCRQSSRYSTRSHPSAAQYSAVVAVTATMHGFSRTRTPRRQPPPAHPSLGESLLVRKFAPGPRQRERLARRVFPWVSDMVWDRVHRGKKLTSKKKGPFEGFLRQRRCGRREALLVMRGSVDCMYTREWKSYSRSQKTPLL